MPNGAFYNAITKKKNATCFHKQEADIWSISQLVNDKSISGQHVDKTGTLVG